MARSSALLPDSSARDSGSGGYGETGDGGGLERVEGRKERRVRIGAKRGRNMSLQCRHIDPGAECGCKMEVIGDLTRIIDCPSRRIAASV